jgi:hypothetical protein
MHVIAGNTHLHMARPMDVNRYQCPTSGVSSIADGERARLDGHATAIELPRILGAHKSRVTRHASQQTQRRRSADAVQRQRRFPDAAHVVIGGSVGAAGASLALSSLLQWTEDGDVRIAGECVSTGRADGFGGGIVSAGLRCTTM